LTAELAAASLNGAIPGCAVRAAADSLRFECSAEHPYLLSELAHPAAAIVRRTATTIEGTGPFLVSSWEPRKRLVLSAWEEYWGGRAYLDSIEFSFGQSYREQSLALEVGKLDIAQQAFGDLGGTSSRGRWRMVSSPPAELLTLTFSPASSSAADTRV